MISKPAIRRYLGQTFDDWVWLKSLKKEDLLEELQAWRVVPNFKTEPYLHQLVCFWLGAKFSSFAFLVDMGLGKSKINLDVLAYRRRRYLDWTRTLIIAHNEAAVENWRQQVEEHSTFSYTSLLGEKARKRELMLTEDTDVHITSYGGLQSLMTETKKGQGRKPNEKWCSKLFSTYDAVVIDESHNCMTKTSLNWRLVSRIARRAAVTYINTGTPFGRDPVALVPQYELVDPDTFGTLEMYRAAFCRQVEQYIAKDQTIWVDVFDKKRTRDFYRRIKHRAIWYAEEDCFDLPPIYRIPRVSGLTTAQRKTLLDLRERVREGVLEGGKYFHFARWVTAGYLKEDDDEGPITREFSPCPKLDDLESVVVGFGPEQPFLIFYEYTDSGRRICERLTKLGVSHVWMWGEAKDKAGLLRKFQQGKVRAMVAQSKSGGTSLNLQITNRVLIFESPTSPILRNQLERRVRPRMQESVFYWDFQAKGTLDQKVLEYLAEGKDLQQALLVGKPQQGELF